MSTSVHDKLEKVRKPRVHIRYDIETEGASESKELPFNVGVMGDFTGDSKDKKNLKERQFVQIDGENFDDVMEGLSPSLNFKVENTLKGDDSELAVNLTFNSMEDFEPDKLVHQVEPLKKLMETRKQLNELLGKADLSEELEETLENILQNTEGLDAMATKLGIDAKKSDADDDNGAAPAA
ncbi:MAG: type VI secretion system contractile sheath small subunit [Gammaproteobacteria bacterium]|nr:type VI secretion system contractile sheath small subunit [Gammaproteobacteria bacterium]